MQLRLGEPPLINSALTTDLHPLAPREPDRSEIVGRKGSIFYRAHSYHTKVPPEGIARLIEHYTDPGEVVLDPFCGSGMTGVAARMTGRRGVLSDLSPAACHIARGYAAVVDPRLLRNQADGLLASLSELEQILYGTSCPTCSKPSRIEYTVWSDVHACPSCSSELVFWSEAVDGDTGAIAKQITCSCGTTSAKRDLVWLRSEPVLESISCPGCRRVERVVDASQRARILSIGRDSIHTWYPSTPFESWREMWRGQHRTQSVETAADFFTPRNLHALADTWAAIGAVSDVDLRQALGFAFTAILNRASRRYQWNPKRPTNVLTSTMYIASLSYEFNVFSLLRRKLTSTVDLYRATSELAGEATVDRAPAQALAHVPDASVHYVFTDPPFGSNIFYADSSFLWEAWLGEATDTTREAVVHQSQRAEHGGKTLQDYEKLMAEAFTEMSRVLRPNGWASVMFHNSSDEVWSALERAIETAGFEVGAAVAFDKSQASFKGIKGQIAGERVPNFDLVLHLQRRTTSRSTLVPESGVVDAVLKNRLTEHVRQAAPNRKTTPYLHSLVMRVLLEDGLPLAGYTYRAVEALCEELFEWENGTWSLPHDGKVST